MLLRGVIARFPTQVHGCVSVKKASRVARHGLSMGSSPETRTGHRVPSCRVMFSRYRGQGHEGLDAERSLTQRGLPRHVWTRHCILWTRCSSELFRPGEVVKDSTKPSADHVTVCVRVEAGARAPGIDRRAPHRCKAELHWPRIGRDVSSDQSIMSTTNSGSH